MRTKVFALLMATTALTAFVNPGHSQTWNAGAQWSTTRNPNGAWSYGRRWSQNGDGFDLCSYMYGGTFWLLCSTCWAPSIQAGPDLWANDNANGYPVVRWTCPRTGTYTIASTFVAADGRGNNNLVWIVVGGLHQYSQATSKPTQASCWIHKYPVPAERSIHRFCCCLEWRHPCRLQLDSSPCNHHIGFQRRHSNAAPEPDQCGGQPARSSRFSRRALILFTVDGSSMTRMPRTMSA